MKLSSYLDLKIGEGFITAGVMSSRQVDSVLLNQKLGDPRRFGDIAVYLHYLEERELDKYLYLKHFAAESVSSENLPSHTPSSNQQDEYIYG